MLQRLFDHLLAPRLALAAARAAAGRRGLKAMEVLGAHMAPTLEPQDIAWFEPAYPAWAPGRGQVLVLSLVQWGPKLVPSRMVAGPGDTVELRDGVLFVNQQPVDEPYVQPGRAEQDPSRRFPLASVPEGHAWMLGDFRDMSQDSRSLGPIALAAVVGRVTHAHRPGAHARPRGVR